MERKKGVNESIGRKEVFEMRIRNIIIGAATVGVLLGGAIACFIKTCSEIEKIVQRNLEEARRQREIMERATRIQNKVNWIKEGF